MEKESTKLKTGEKLTGAYIGFNLANVGGYSTETPSERMTSSAQFVDNKDVIKLAKKEGFKQINLAGNWESLGKKGFGEKVSIAEAKRLMKLKLKRVI